MDFGALPPEVNSARMYAGPGSAPLLAAVSAWAGLAGELRAALAGHQSVLTELTEDGWQGPASSRMAAAVSPLLAWLESTAERAEQAATQMSAAVAAFDSAYAMTVPPLVIAANRAQLAALVATNVLGVNTSAIAATEAEYGQMWAQDTAAMYGYAAQSAAATKVTPFSRPKQATDPAGQGAQGAAVAQAGGAQAGSAAESTMSQALAATPNALQAMSSPLPPTPTAPPTPGASGFLGLNAGDVSNLMSNLSSSSFSPMSLAGITQIGADAAVMHSVANGGVVGPYGGVIPGWGEGLLSPGGIAPDLLTPGAGISMVQPAGLGAGSLAAQVSPAANQVSAGFARGSLVGAMSVPQSWSAALPAATPVPPAASLVSSVNGAAGAAGAPGVPGLPVGGTGHRGIGFAAPRYGFKVPVMPRPVVAG